MDTRTLRDIWAEPAPEPADRSWLDKAVILLLAALGLLDGLLSENVAWPTVTIPLMVAISFSLYWRRSHILAVAMIVSAAYTGLHGAMLIAGVSSTTVNVGVLGVTVYTLARWASGREAIIGLGIASIGVGVAGSTGLLREASGAVGFPAVISLFVLAGIAVRLWSGRRAALLNEAKMGERNRIARELHDTVAHHVSAIAIQAQGGQEILASNPGAAGEALAVIEEQASLTLAEMRLILGVLRDQDPSDRKPQSGIEDVANLSDIGTSGLKVDVSLSGELENVSPAVGSAIFRIAQEAVTNARRHGAGATSVEVEVVGSMGHVHLNVRDDGRANPQAGPGYGLLGMTERAALLGGHCEAGPLPSGGWSVKASLPRNGRPS